MAQVRITVTDGRQKVEIDGVEVQDVVAIGFNTAADEQTEVTLVLAPNTVVIECPVDKIISAQLNDPARYDSRGY